MKTTPTRSARRLAAGLRAASRALAGAASLCLMTACSADGQEAFDRYLDPFLADVYVHNGTGEDLELSVHPLAPALALDCDAVAEDPAALAAGPSFEAAASALLIPGATAPARDVDTDTPRERECHAALLELDASARVVLFWYDEQLALDWVDGLIDDPADHRPGAVLVTRGPSRALRVESQGEPIVYPVTLQ